MKWRCVKHDATQQIPNNKRLRSESENLHKDWSGYLVCWVHRELSGTGGVASVWTLRASSSSGSDPNPGPVFAVDVSIGHHNTTCAYQST